MTQDVLRFEFDAAGLSEDERDQLVMEVLAQADRSDGHPSVDAREVPSTEPVAGGRPVAGDAPHAPEEPQQMFELTLELQGADQEDEALAVARSLASQFATVVTVTEVTRGRTFADSDTRRIVETIEP